jgi:hypothetical protein
VGVNTSDYVFGDSTLKKAVSQPKQPDVVIKPPCLQPDLKDEAALPNKSTTRLPT